MRSNSTSRNPPRIRAPHRHDPVRSPGPGRGAGLTSAEQAAVEEALRAARLELRQARREQHIDDVFARYGGGAHDDAVERRIQTLGYEVLTDPPDWVIEQLQRLHDDGRLGTTRVSDLATRIVAAAVHLDRHGHLPDGWTDVGVRPATREVPVVEIEVPGL